MTDTSTALGSGEELTIRGLGSGTTIWYFHDEVSAQPGPVATGLAERFRVLAPVHPGFAEAERPRWVETVLDIADLYLEPVRSGGGQLVLIGSSIGAWIATEVALALYDLEPRLVLIGPLGLYVRGNLLADHWFMTDEDRDATLYYDTRNKPDVPIEEYIANESMAARVGWNPRFADRRLAPRLRRLRSPVLTIWGHDDKLVPQVYEKEWAEVLPRATSLVLDECGHYPVYERPDEVVETVTAFIRQEAGAS